jgi:hypothetical protein
MFHRIGSFHPRRIGINWVEERRSNTVILVFPLFPWLSTYTEQRPGFWHQQAIRGWRVWCGTLRIRYRFHIQATKDDPELPAKWFFTIGKINLPIGKPLSVGAPTDIEIKPEHHVPLDPPQEAEPRAPYDPCWSLFAPSADRKKPLMTKPHLSIESDRYSGAYSGSKFTAWVGDTPDAVYDEDIKCITFLQHTNILYGKGSTPQEALYQLLELLNQPIEQYQTIIFTDCGEETHRLAVGSPGFSAWLSQ